MTREQWLYELGCIVLPDASDKGRRAKLMTTPMNPADLDQYSTAFRWLENRLTHEGASAVAVMLLGKWGPSHQRLTRSLEYATRPRG